MKWDDAIKIVTPHVVRISTPSGYGTGFLTFYNSNGRWCGIATAAHVVSHADEWQQPIRIYHQHSDTTSFLNQDGRMIFLDHKNDSAVIFFLKGDLQLPEVPIPLFPVNDRCSLGADIGWLGYPAIEPNSLCFFSGAVSARLEHRGAYLIDGVAINGVSGGPVFHCNSSDQIQIIGCVSAYHANRATGEALRGLLRAQDVSHFHEAADTIRSWDEASAKKAEFEAAQNVASQTQAVAATDVPEAGTAPTTSGGGDASDKGAKQ
jgi:Trypsin-like peptidase domain